VQQYEYSKKISCERIFCVQEAGDDSLCEVFQNIQNIQNIRDIHTAGSRMNIQMNKYCLKEYFDKEEDIH